MAPRAPLSDSIIERSCFICSSTVSRFQGGLQLKVYPPLKARGYSEDLTEGLFLLQLTAGLLVFCRQGPPRLMGHAAVTYRDSMLLFGGGESQKSPNNSLWRYSFPSQSWSQVASLPHSDAPQRIHHCCTGLGRSYESDGVQAALSSQQDAKPRHFKNKCFPVSQSDIEMKTFSKGLCSSETIFDTEKNCLTFENRAFKKQWSCSDDQDISKNLPDMLLVLGGKPFSIKSPISIWSMTLTDS